MKPLRLFVILAFITAVSLAVIFLQLAKLRTLHQVNVLHARQFALRREIRTEEARIAEQSSIQRIGELVRGQSLPVVPRQLPDPPQDQRTARTRRR